MVSHPAPLRPSAHLHPLCDEQEAVVRAFAAVMCVQVALQAQGCAVNGAEEEGCGNVGEEGGGGEGMQ